MANFANTCKNLGIDVKPLPDNDALATIYKMQATLQNFYQQKQGRKVFSDMNLQEVIDFLMYNQHAQNDEANEFLDSIGGIHNGIGSSVWKRWKSDHSKTSQLKISDLSEDDRKEMIFEFVDELHFFMNKAIAVGILPEEIFAGYVSKNAENYKRQINGY